ncbi:MAG: hypothetical protein RML36_01230 [Anaerolineae bacterium]|nr:hypothetical protein [Anaerolineae bacterium]MDW8098091.1 hypothetical protein [Anaerolineae bacterium]
MADLTVYRLAFHSGFHLGVRGVNLEESSLHIPADTLFAALLDAALRAGFDADAFVARFQKGDPPFLLTSAFPYAGGVRFFPMPVPLGRWFRPETFHARLKALKRIRFVSEALFQRMLVGEPMDPWLFPMDGKDDPTQGLALQGGMFWLAAEEAEKLPCQMRSHPRTGRPVPLRALMEHRVFASAQVPRVTVDRVSSASNIFHTGRVSFAPDCGLWFGIAWRDPNAPIGAGELTFREAVHCALAILSYDGLGGERTTGYGGFVWAQESVSLSLPDPAPGELLWLLSRYHPRQEELPGALTSAGVAYELISVAGWLRSWQGAAQRRRRLWLVREGSLVQAIGNGPWGDLTDVRPRYQNPDGDLPHPVWRYGFALGAAVKEVRSV